jgi:HD-like signal output (HDOD) protein
MAARLTSWITRSATSRAMPAPPSSREAVLESILSPAQLPSVSGTAVKVVEVANRPDCVPGEIGAIIAGDPGFSAALLRAVNAARDGPARNVGSVERAVLVIGLNKVRSLALELSLPPLRPQSRYEPAAIAHSLASIGGAIMARELAIRLSYPSPEEDMNAALLRDIGVLLIQQTYPTAWADLTARGGDPLGEDTCERERAVFGIDHAEVSAEVLRRWGLPDDIIEPIRHHHNPAKLADTPYFARAELIWFAGMLTRLEAVVEHPEALDRILSVAAKSFSLSVSALADFLDVVRPKIGQFAETINREIGRCPDYASLLATATAELTRLTPAPRIVKG